MTEGTVAVVLFALVVAAAGLMLRSDVNSERARLEEQDRNPFGALTYRRRANVNLLLACLVLLAVIFGLIVVVAWMAAG